MKQKIQKSMMLILLVTLFPFYVIMTVILYNQNLGILEKEVQQEAVYLSRCGCRRRRISEKIRTNDKGG